MTTESELLETAILIEEMGSTKKPWGNYDVVIESNKEVGFEWLCELTDIDGAVFSGYGDTITRAVRACYYGFKEQAKQ